MLDPSNNIKRMSRNIAFISHCSSEHLLVTHLSESINWSGEMLNPSKKIKGMSRNTAFISQCSSSKTWVLAKYQKFQSQIFAPTSEISLFFPHPSPQHLNSLLHEKNSTYEESWSEAETTSLHKRGKRMFSNIHASRHGMRPHQSGDHMLDSHSGCNDTEGLGLHRIHLARVAGVA